MNHRSIVYSWCVLLLSTLSGWAAPALVSSEAALDQVTLQLKWKHQFQFAGYYAALEQGFYRDAGLDVQIIEAHDDVDSTRQVVNGHADFGVAMSDLVQHRALGEPVVVLASIFQHSPLVLLSCSSAGIDNIHDLSGKKISLEPHSEQILCYLESEGLPQNKFITYPHDYNVQKLIDGEVDAMSAYSTDEPFLLQLQGIDYNVFTPRSGGIDFYGDTLFTTEAQIREHPKRVAAFLDASLKGWQYAIDHSEEVVDLILSDYSTRHSREHLLFEATMTKRLIMADVVELGYVNPGRWGYIAESFKELGRIPKNFSIQGFIYDRNPKPNLVWVYVSLLGTVVVVALAFLITARFYALNKALKREVLARQLTINELHAAEKHIKKLRGIIPICMHCKEIRDDKGYWKQLEEYISEHSDAKFSHSVCDKCMAELYPEFVERDQREIE